MIQLSLPSIWDVTYGSPVCPGSGQYLPKSISHTLSLRFATTQKLQYNHGLIEGDSLSALSYIFFMNVFPFFSISFSIDTGTYVSDLGFINDFVVLSTSQSLVKGKLNKATGLNKMLALVSNVAKY